MNSFHPKSRKSLEAIYKYDLARYMRWYPWRWFSDLVLVGSGGFSAVYGANISLLYDVSETGQQFGVQRRPVAIKVVDEKILNEVCMICIWELKKNMFVLGGGRGKETLRKRYV